MRKALLLFAFLYFNLSTYTLLQWIKQHVPYEAEGRHHLIGEPRAVSSVQDDLGAASRVRRSEGSPMLSAPIAAETSASAQNSGSFGSPSSTLAAASSSVPSIDLRAQSMPDGDPLALRHAPNTSIVLADVGRHLNERPRNGDSELPAPVEGADARVGGELRGDGAEEQAEEDEEAPRLEEDGAETSKESSEHTALEGGVADAKADISATGLELDEGLKAEAAVDDGIVTQIAATGDKKARRPPDDAVAIAPLPPPPPPLSVISLTHSVKINHPRTHSLTLTYGAR
eukprot:5853851-Pleurochrysis_carterae.AAC.1